MKSLRWILSVLALIAFVGRAQAQLDTLYQEHFTNGNPSLDWFDPWSGGVGMTTQFVSGNPSGDGWVGKVDNASSGGGVGTALAGVVSLTDYEVQAWIYCTVSTSSGGSYHAIIARCDTTGGLMFYYLRTDFDTDQRLQLRMYDGSQTGVTIATWTGAQIPGGVPTTNSWHHMALKCQGNQLWAWWDNVLLNGSPFTHSDLSNGFFGAYVFNFALPAQTLCDDILVIGDAGPQPFDLVPGTAQIRDQNHVPMAIRPAVGQTVYFNLFWNAVNGTTTSPAFNNRLYIDNNPIFQENHPGVQPNSSDSTESNAWVATLGDHQYRWVLDAGNTVPESNENNNTLADSFKVLPVGSFDLSADSATLTSIDGYPLADPDTITVNTQVHFRLYWSVPMGSGFSNAFDIKMRLDGNPAYFYTTTFPAVQSPSQHVTTTGLWTATPGFHYYEWFLDATNLIDEFSEYNNSTLNGVQVVSATGVPGLEPVKIALPSDLAISGVYPNPFNPTVTLRCQVAQAGMVKLSVYDVSGRQVAVLYDGFQPRGSWEVSWDGSRIAAGSYFAVLESNGQKAVQPLFLVK